MITDVLFKRYPDPWIGTSGVPVTVATLIRQAAIAMVEDIAPNFRDPNSIYANAERKLARELGMMGLGPHSESAANCMAFLGVEYDLWDNSHGSPDRFVKLRLSLIELLYREAQETLRANAPRDQDVDSWWRLIRARTAPGYTQAEKALTATVKAIDELNQRFRESRLPLEFHDGIIQRVDDALINEQIERPFWDLLTDKKYAQISTDIKESIDRRDAGKADAAFHAMKALEGVIRILSDELDRSRGTERGASEFIDNLVAERPHRFVDVWESQALKLLFREIRNPLGHGTGNSQTFELSAEQSTWVIESSMSWIKCLVRRRRAMGQ